MQEAMVATVATAARVATAASSVAHWAVACSARKSGTGSVSRPRYPRPSIVAVGRWHSLASKRRQPSSSYSWNRSRCTAAEPWEVAVATAAARAVGWRAPGRAHRAEAKARAAEARAAGATATVAVVGLTVAERARVQVGRVAATGAAAVVVAAMAAAGWEEARAVVATGAAARALGWAGVAAAVVAKASGSDTHTPRPVLRSDVCRWQHC